MILADSPGARVIFVGDNSKLAVICSAVDLDGERGMKCWFLAKKGARLKPASWDISNDTVSLLGLEIVRVCVLMLFVSLKLIWPGEIWID